MRTPEVKNYADGIKLFINIVKIHVLAKGFNVFSLSEEPNSSKFLFSLCRGHPVPSFNVQDLFSKLS